MSKKVKRKNNIKAKILVLVFSLFISSCITYEKNKYVGIFESSEASRYITLTDVEFVILDSTKTNNVNNRPCNIVSFGNWKIDEDKLLILNSSNPIYENFFIDFDVSFNDIATDSIYFKIDIPIQPNENKFFSYELNITYDGEYDFGKQLSKPFKKQLISIKMPPFGVKIKSIGVTINYERPFSNSIEHYLGITTVSTIEKEVPHHNYYILKIPIDLCYFEYERYNEEYVKIIDQNTLMWNNIKYLRKK